MRGHSSGRKGRSHSHAKIGPAKRAHRSAAVLRRTVEKPVRVRDPAYLLMGITERNGEVR
jgi:hypothetical protein